MGPRGQLGDGVADVLSAVAGAAPGRRRLGRSGFTRFRRRFVLVVLIGHFDQCRGPLTGPLPALT